MQLCFKYAILGWISCRAVRPNDGQSQILAESLIIICGKCPSVDCARYDSFKIERKLLCSLLCWLQKSRNSIPGEIYFIQFQFLVQLKVIF